MTDDEAINQLRGEFSDIIDQINYPEDTLSSFRDRYKDKQVIFILPGFKTSPVDLIIDFEAPTVVAKVGKNTFKISNFEKMLYSKEKNVILV